MLPIILNNDKLPYVDEVKHLGHTLSYDNNMSKDCNIKRGIFIGKMHSLAQEFYFSSPEVLMKLLNVYTSSFYGSNLYNLFSKDCKRLYAAWNCAVRIAFKVDNCTHHYLIETISQSLHPKVYLSSRFVKFTHAMQNNSKSIVRVLSNLFKYDNRTVLGQNLNNISRKCQTKINDLTTHHIKSNMKYFEVPEDEKWRISIVHELLMLKNNVMEIEGFTKGEINNMLLQVCSS